MKKYEFKSPGCGTQQSVLMSSSDDADVWSSLGVTGYKNKMNKIENNIYKRPDRLNDPICRAIIQ